MQLSNLEFFQISASQRIVKFADQFVETHCFSICTASYFRCVADNLTMVCIDLFILKNMGAAIIDFRVCPPLVKCKNLMFSGFIDTVMYGFSSTGVTIYCFGLKFNDNTCCEVICKRRYNDNDIMTTNKLPGMYFFFNYRYFPHTKSV